MRQVRGQAKKSRKVKSASARYKTGCRHTYSIDQAKTNSKDLRLNATPEQKGTRLLLFTAVCFKTTQLHYTRAGLKHRMPNPYEVGEDAAELTGALRALTSHLKPCLACLIPGHFPPMQCALQSSSAARTALASRSARSAISSWTASTGAMRSSAVKVGRGRRGVGRYLPLRLSQVAYFPLMR